MTVTMQARKLLMLFMLGTALVVGWTPWAYAGMGQPRPIKTYEGQIKSIKIDKCELEPGTCEGSIVLAMKGGGDATLALKPGSWIKRADKMVTIRELGVGNYVQVQAVELPREPVPRVTFMDASVP